MADEPADLSVLQCPDTVRVANTRRRYKHIDDLREQGLSMRAIARRLNVNFKTVRRYIRASSVDVLVAGGVQVSVLDPFKPYLNGRLADGERNATRLLAELANCWPRSPSKGYTGGYNTLNRYLRPLLQHSEPEPATAAIARRSHARGAATATGSAGGTESHRLDHRPAEQPRSGGC